MILCCGEALIDMIPAPTNTGRDGFVPHSGGAVLNTAIALGRLGAKSGMLTGLSNDLFGEQLSRHLEASHVDTSLIVRSDRPTTLAFVELTGGHAQYTFYDENSAGRMLSPGDLPKIPADVNALFFGGISLTVEPAADTYSTLCAEAGETRVVMIDPNIRPGFVKDAERYRARLMTMLRRADIVKVSDEDLEWIFPDGRSLSEKLARLRDLGPKLTLLTRGGKGAEGWLAAGAHVTVPARPVKVADTVGAGDTFNAGVLAALEDAGLLTPRGVATLSADDARAAIGFGARAASITVSRSGAEPPWREEMQET